jgi:hypothetical protein
MASTQEISARLVLPGAVHANSRIEGTLEITNRGSKAVEMVSPHFNAALNIVVFDSLWNEVPANSLGKAHIGHQRFELAPGQTVCFELIDLAFATGTSRMGYKLRSGVYYVLAIYHPGTARLPGQSSYPIAIASNVAKLAVV